MIDIHYECQADLPADTVWEELRHFDRVLRWVPGGGESTLTTSGNGPGMVRDIHLTTQGYVQHRLLELNEANRRLSYELTDGKPLGMQDYTVVVAVTPVDANHCTIRWDGRMTADDSLDEAETGRALRVGLQNMTTGLIALLKGETPDYVNQPNEDWQLSE